MVFLKRHNNVDFIKYMIYLSFNNLCCVNAQYSIVQVDHIWGRKVNQLCFVLIILMLIISIHQCHEVLCISTALIFNQIIIVHEWLIMKLLIL